MELRIRRIALVLPLLALALAYAVCGSPARGPESTPANAPTPAGTPLPNQPPQVAAGAALIADQGYEALREGSFIDPDDLAWSATVDFGDGTPVQPLSLDGQSFRLRHTYARTGSFAATVSVADSRGAIGNAVVPIIVAPRRVVFVQGIESESRCPGGSGFASHAPRWVGAYLASDATMQAQLPIADEDLVMFSYSGRYCSGNGTHGEAASYGPGDTCDGIEGATGAASRLRSLIDTLAPGRVTILGHSMGGLVAAYLAGEDPDWAGQHIASIVAFDSPLGGVPRLNLEALRFAGAVTGGCSFDSRSVEDMKDGDSLILRTARNAAHVVPFYTLDATAKEGLFVGIREAVPGDRTHLRGEILGWKVSASHSDLWDAAPRGPLSANDKRRPVGCALLRFSAKDCANNNDPPMVQSVR